MAVDTSIYGLVRPPSTPFNLTGTLRDVESLRGLTLQRKSLQRQEADAERENQERAAVRDVFAKNVDETGSLNRKAVLADLAKVSPMKAMELQTTFRKMDAEDAVAQQKMLANRMEQMGALADLALSAKDQASYDALRASAQQMGLDASLLPAQMPEPGILRRWAMTAMSLKDRLAAQQHNLAVRKQESDERLAQEKLGIERDKAKREGRESSMKVAADLRKERSGLPTTKATQEISAAYNKIQKAAANPSAAGDMSMIFGYMKLLDPGSTVREGEFATAQNATGVPGQVMNLYNRILSGERLSPEQRADFLNQARGLYSAQRSQQMKVDKDFQRLAKKYGVEPEDVLVNFEADQAAAPPETKTINGVSYRKVPGGWEEMTDG